ncbi:hypothetical protein PAXINDRAFT_9491 [Paxillus involutus ATCC 200175]|nr:hypothetical protein PAXINDRAFT_9491 [Paxillus involutus ATCC 200175]
MRACREWRYTDKILAHPIKEDLHHSQWTRTHAFFTLMGGFVLQDGMQRTQLAIQDVSDLEHLRNGRVANLNLTEEDINEKSNSDSLGKAILVLQISWFILQIIVRGANNLAITLLELDTLAMAVLSFVLFSLWWRKPMAPERPHIFYLKDSSIPPDVPETSRLDSALPDERHWWAELTFGQVYDANDHYDLWALLLVWVIFGALHTIAWNFQFPTHTEQTLWRSASLTLLSLPIIIYQLPTGSNQSVVDYITLGAGVAARFILLVVMLASLRDLPASAYETVSWTAYVPHL